MPPWSPSHTASATLIGSVPVRNLWLMMLYASDLFRMRSAALVAVEELPDELPDLVAEVLAAAVEARHRRRLTAGYRRRHAVLGRVRGRIDLLETESNRLLARGRVACSFDDLSIDTPRNRFVRAALGKAARLVRRPELAHRCRTLDLSLKHAGVAEDTPDRRTGAIDGFGRHDEGDRVMVAAARLMLELALPTESVGTRMLMAPDRSETWVRHLFERAVGGFYGIYLEPLGWRVAVGQRLSWQIESATDGIHAILPSMQTDIVLTHASLARRIVIDTKFTAILTRGRFREASLRSGYIYQIYAYLRSRTGSGDPLCDEAEGLMLHPSVGQCVDEAVRIQGHTIRFATVDLAAPAADIRRQLLEAVQPVRGLRPLPVS